MSYVQKPNREIRFLHDKTFAEIILLLRTPVVIRVRNGDAARALKKFFDPMWEQGKP